MRSGGPDWRRPAGPRRSRPRRFVAMQTRKEAAMRKIVAGAFVSLDGVMQAPGGPQEDPTGGFKFGGWTAPYWDDAIGAVMGEAFSKPFDLLLGRKTYDIFAAHWPYIETDPSASTFDALNAQVANTFNS